MSKVLSRLVWFLRKNFWTGSGVASLVALSVLTEATLGLAVSGRSAETVGLMAGEDSILAEDLASEGVGRIPLPFFPVGFS